jgi:hypothetical protein
MGERRVVVESGSDGLYGFDGLDGICITDRRIGGYSDES